jgi:hypothetical protein
VPTVKYGGARQLTFPLKTCCAVKHRRCGEGVEPILSEACSQGYPESAICVQKLDDSLNSAIRITYRISLRSSSLGEPRYPLLRIVLVSYFLSGCKAQKDLVQSDEKGVNKYNNQFSQLAPAIRPTL